MIVVFVIVSVYDHAELLPFFLEHYQELGVQRMFLSIRTPSAYRHVQSLLKSFPYAVSFYSLARRFSDTNKAVVERKILARMTKPYDWIMHLDLDEFQQYPAPLSDIVQQSIAQRIQAIRGKIIDRVAADGMLQPVRPMPSIWEQFPVVADLTGALLGACRQKIMLCQNFVRLKGSVRHKTMNVPTDRVPIGTSDGYLVHHFKWLEGLDKRLEARLAQDRVGRAYRRESTRFLEYFRQHGEMVDLADVRLRARRMPSPFRLLSVLRKRDELERRQMVRNMPRFRTGAIFQ